MSLGEAFPDNFKREFANRQLKPGVVIKAFVDDTNPPKEKRFIVVGTNSDSNEAAVIFINSELRLHANWNITFKNAQKLLKSDNREFLDKDSYVDCARLYKKNLRSLKENLKENPGLIIGNLSENDEKLIFGTLSGSQLLSTKEKRKFNLI